MSKIQLHSSASPPYNEQDKRTRAGWGNFPFSPRFPVLSRQALTRDVCQDSAFNLQHAQYLQFTLSTQARRGDNNRKKFSGDSNRIHRVRRAREEADIIMKQAYTNTIRGGGGRPLTIATGSKKARKSNSNVPKCAYGSACNRKGCAFRHDKPTNNATQQYESYHDDPKSKICKQFLGGICSYGNKCLNRHPGEEEA